MPAVVPAAGALGAKIVTVFPGNAEQNKPLIHAIVILIDPDDGSPLALLDGRALTALRTGAASGVATRLLARPEAATLACFGAGAQAEQQIEAVCAVRPINRVLICSRTASRAAALADRLLTSERVPAAVRVEADPARVAAQADVICTATTSATPVFPADAVRPGTHINGVGSYTPHMAEVPAALVGRARVVVDQAAAARAEAGDLIQAVAAGLAPESIFDTELGQVAAGERPGRTGPEEITFFKSVGNAVQDMAVARYAVSEALRLGRGQTLEL
jgi:ornithine cyclodeaminase